MTGCAAAGHAAEGNAAAGCAALKAGSPSAIERRKQAALAGHRGEPATARSLLVDEDSEVRCAALRALDLAGDLDPAELRAALEDPVPAVRVTALELAGTRREIVITAGLDDNDPRVVEAAAWACGERQSAAGGIISKLAELAGGHSDALCRESAVAALGAIADPAGLAAILGGLDDAPAVRRRAVIALAPFEGPEVAAAFSKARSDPDRQVRDAVEDLAGP